jgi:hypothetical protein
MLEPLFDNNSRFVGWIDPGRHMFDPDMRWIAFLAGGHAWSPETASWLGPVQGLTCFDREGRVVAWSPRRLVTGLVPGAHPIQPTRPARPLRPLAPVRPLRPIRPLTPVRGWSPIAFENWLSQPEMALP